MAEYFLDEEGQIYGDFAYRLGKIIHQYEHFVDINDKENFISTLCISSLQSLLTIYIESFIVNNGYPCTRKNFIFDSKKSISDTNYFKIENKWVTYNDKFNRGVSVFNFLKQLRNALSHPNDMNKRKSTGYSSINVNGAVSSYLFSSYDLNNDKLFVIEIETKDLVNLTKKLAILLSQPVIKNWDGLTLNENILNINYAA
jgi:hypothetical protein